MRGRRDDHILWTGHGAWSSLLFRWVLGLVVLLLVPRGGAAQDLVPHGTITQLRGETVEVEVKSFYDVPDEATGTVYTKNIVGEAEQIVKVAKVDVETVDGASLVGRVTEQVEGVPLQSGYRVSFQPVRQNTDGFPGRGVLRVTTLPTEAEVTVHPLRVTATGRTVYLESRALGATPLADSLLPGRYRLTIRREGYQPVRRSVFLHADSVTADSVQLKRLREGPQ
jgi:hypothetical protein